MTNWKETTLGEIAEFSNGRTSPERFDSGKYEVFGSNGVIGLSDEINSYENTIIIGRVGSYCGSLYFSKNRCWVTDNAIKANAKENNDPFYLYYLLIIQQLNKKAAGSGQPLINQEILNSIEVTVPPFPEQRVIASILLSFDDKIELLRRQNKTLESIAQTIFKEWFIKFKIENLKLKIDSKTGLPEGWRMGRIGDLINVFSGFAFSSTDFTQSGKYKLVTIKNVQDRYFDPKTKDRLDVIPDKMPDYCHLRTGHILLSLTGNVGRICLVVGENYLLNQRVAKLEPIEPIDYAFSYLLFLQDPIFSLLQSIASGTAQQNLSPVQTKEVEIITPPRKILDQFGLLTNPVVGKINFNNSQIQTLSKLRDTLLPKLMKGEIRVANSESIE